MNTNDRARFTFRIPQRLFLYLSSTAKERGVSTNAFMLEIVHRHFEETLKKLGKE